MSDIVLIVGEIIVGLALLTVIGGAVAVAVTRLTPKASPEDVLRERYARGELTREQYEQARRDLAIPSMLGDSLQVLQPNGREEEVVQGSSKTK